MNICKVSGTSAPKKVAGYIAHNIEKNQDVQLQVIGAAAVNQCIKAIAIARTFLAKQGVDLVCSPNFSVMTSDDKTYTILKILVKRQQNLLVS